MINLADFRGDWESIRKILPALIAKYEDEIKEAPNRLSIRGKTGPEAQKEQCSWPIHYGLLKAEVNKLLRYLEARETQVRGERTKWYIESYPREHSERARDKLIDHEPVYVQMRELYLEVEELKEKLSAVCDAFDRRGFALRDWTALKVHEITDLTI